MPEEQIIYLDPNDELTRVREKIEENPAQHITLVVPQQTQLRSNTGWRLLYARSREMRKDIQVVSPDRQVRSLAKAAGFTVSESREASLVSKFRTSNRPASRPSRGAVERKAAQPRRGTSGRSADIGRALRQREQPDPQAQSPDQPTQSTWRQGEDLAPPPEETITGQGAAPSYPSFDIIEDDAYDRAIEFRIDEAHAPRPLPAHQEEEEQDPYSEDYRTARDIREAAQGTRSGESRPPIHEQELPETLPPALPGVPPAPLHADLFGDNEDFPPSSLPEQHAGTFAPDVDDVMPDISEVPTDVHEIEFLGDQGDFVDVQGIPTHQLPGETSDEAEDIPPPRTYGARSRGSRSGNLPRRPLPGVEDEDYLPPPSQGLPTARPAPRPSGSLSAPRPSGSLNAPRAGSRGPQPPPSRPLNTRPISQPRPIPRSSRPLAPPPRRQPGRAGRQRSGRTATIVIVSLLLLLLIGVGVLYFGTNATVTITVPSTPYTLKSLTLEATTNPQDKVHNTVGSQMLSFNASVSGPGTATGSTQQGNAKATGTVNIVNKGSVNVPIPTGTVFTTNGGAGSVQFITTASPVALKFDPNNPNLFVPVPVEAVLAGSSGNVNANTITVIPASSINAIATADSIPASSINLNVSNPAALSGGGAAQVPAVTSNDLKALERTLHQQLQAQINTWLKGQVHQGDIQGMPDPNVTGSAQPLPQEQLAQTPAIGKPLPDKTFTGQLSAHISVLIVRADNFQTAVQQRLSAAALAMRPTPYILATQLPIKPQNVVVTPAKDGSSILIKLSATGRLIPRVNTQDVSAYLSGKTVDQAKSDIDSGSAGLRVVEDVKIEVSPAFLSIMPFRPEHIHVIILPGA